MSVYVGDTFVFGVCVRVCVYCIWVCMKHVCAHAVLPVGGGSSKDGLKKDVVFETLASSCTGNVMRTDCQVGRAKADPPLSRFHEQQ